MNESIDYAEMLEIPVSTVNVVRKKSRKKRIEPEDIKEEVLKTVNERVEETTQEPVSPEQSERQNVLDGRIATSEDLTEDYDYTEQPYVKPKSKFFDGKIITAQFIAVLVLAATIFLTNIFWKDSAINTFFNNLLNPVESVVEDDRIYSQLTMGSIVNDDSISITVAENGVLSFTGECSVYSACDGKILSVEEKDGLYTIVVEHTSSFTTQFSNLSNVYFSEGDTVYSTIPVGYSNGQNTVSVSMFDSGNMINAYTVNEDNGIVWNA